MPQDTLSEQSLCRNLTMGSTPYHSIHAAFFPPKRTTTLMTKNWWEWSSASNADNNTFWEHNTQSTCAQTTKTFNTSKNHRKSQAIKLAGWNSYKTLTIILNTSQGQWTQSQTSYPVTKTLTRGWILIHHGYSFPTPYSFEKSFLKMTQTSGETSYDKSMTPQQEDTPG